MKNRAKVKNLPIDYDIDAIRVTHNCGMLRQKNMEIATNTFGKDKICDADAICAMKIHGKVQQTFIAIATLVKKNHKLAMNYRRY
jgi:hypothetical protein